MAGDLALGVDRVDVSVVSEHVAVPRVVRLDAAARAAIETNAAVAARWSVMGVAYGRTTGVGANRDTPADDADGDHGRRLVRSHATGAGADRGPRVGAASMVIRAHQLSRPGSGIGIDVVDGLVAAIRDGRTAPVRTAGGLGTGDITQLGELACCLLGELPWHGGERHAYLDDVPASSALAFMSSSAPTLAVAALAIDECRALVDASLAVAALSALAVRANDQQWSDAAAGTRPSTGVDRVAAVFRSVSAGGGVDAARTQDPLGFRTAPFVAGPLVEVVAEAIDEIDRAIDARAENPRFADDGVHHHGAFMLTSLGLRLDVVRLALVQWASTSLARLVKLHDPAYTGQARFLAVGPAGSSGTMVLEYTSASALETVRTLADPTTRHTVTISVGNEDHASFATRGADALAASLSAFRTVVACELLAAVRAIRATPAREVGPLAERLLRECSHFPEPGPDRVLVDEISAAETALPSLASVIRES
jgi:histidine ammonia-lyase